MDHYLVQSGTLELRY